MTKTYYGRLDNGVDIYKFTLKSEDSTAEIINYGATIVSFAPFGKEIIAAFDRLEDFCTTRDYRGGSVGRVCNRIADAEFTMDGKLYKLTSNEEHSCLHGGFDAYSHRPWDVIDYGVDFVKLGLISPDGDGGFPSRVDIEATFRLSGASLEVSFKAIPYGKTPIMLTTHGYFNLDSLDGTIEDHKFTIYADEYTEVDDRLLPLGRASVEGTPFDFRHGKTLREGLLERPAGFDHNFVLSANCFISKASIPLALAAVVEGKTLRMSTYTNQPGIQLYVQMNSSDDSPLLVGGKKQFGKIAFCLEPQIEPNCIKSGIGFYDKGEVYESVTLYKVEKI